jgi:Uma2 family endonuclease
LAFQEEGDGKVPTNIMVMDQTVVVREPMSLEEFFQLDVELIELVDGQPVLLSAATGPHQHAVLRLGRLLDDNRPADHRVLPSPIDWVLWSGERPTVRQPDLAVVAVDQAREKRLTRPPLLAVEVLSVSSVERDLVAKRRDYARAGCEHYWIVNLAVPEVVVLAMQEGAYVEVARLIGGKTGTISAPFKVTFDPSVLLV